MVGSNDANATIDLYIESLHSVSRYKLFDFGDIDHVQNKNTSVT